MRSVLFPLVFSCTLVLAPAVSRAALPDAQRLQTPQLQGLLESEFAFQSGQFVQALEYYKSRPVEDLSLPELVRGGQLAVAAGDSDWLRQILASPAASGALELSEMRFAEGLRAGDGQASLRAWRALMAQPRGVDLARDVVESHSPLYRPELERTLALYTLASDLSEGERYELFLYAVQWRQDALADRLLQDIGTTGGQAVMAGLMNACLRGSQAQCLAKIDVLEPQDFDEIQRRSVLTVARRLGLDRQAYRWMMALPQDSSSYYQRIIQQGRQYDEATSAALSADIERDAGLTHFQRAALLGSIAELRKDWPAAEGYYREALARDTPTTASIRLAVVLFRQNRKSEALQLLADIQRDETLSDEIRRESFATEIQFLQLAAPGGNAAPALLNDIYRRALIAWPRAHRMRYQYAMRLFSQGQMRQSLDELQEILRMAPADTDALNAYGYTLAKEMDRPRTALKPIEKAFLLAPNRAEILDSYGYVLHRLGRNDQALPPLQKAWDAAPSAVTAGHLAQVLLELGDKRQAQDYLDKGLQLDASEAELVRLKEQFP
jgi:tetratricopeptide (TPR) repeat protein